MPGKGSKSARQSEPEILHLSPHELDDIKTRIESIDALSASDKKVVQSILSTYQWLYGQLEAAKLSIRRLKRLFGFKTEKSKKSNESEKGNDQNAKGSHSGSTDTTSEEEDASKKKKRPQWDPAQNHGRRGADEYEGCEDIGHSDSSLQPGSACPECAQYNTPGKLYRDTPQTLVRLKGSPLISGTRHTAERFRCNVCNTRFQAAFPPEVKEAPKYDASCSSALALARYSLGLPLHRIETQQAMHNIPISDATQYDLLSRLYKVVEPIHGQLIQHAAQGEQLIYDDTSGRILEHQAEGKATHTTALISVTKGRSIHLYFTGRNPAGKNVDNVMQARTSEEPVAAMMDASPHNIPKRLPLVVAAQFILCFCLVHGRRKFFEVFHFFEQSCAFVLEVIGQVYQNEAYCKQKRLLPEQRLRYHQTHSRPRMDSLYQWLNNQILYELTEENGGLGQAVQYMLKHWSMLTRFLSVPGAPLDSSWAERSIKVAIRHRRNSLFYKTTQGALVGDCLMSLIETARRNGVNAFEYLNALQRHADAVAANPEQWLPWNYPAQPSRQANAA